MLIRPNTLSITLPLALTVTFGFQLFRQWITGLFYYLNEVAAAGYAVLIALAVVIFGATFFAGVIQHRLGARAVLIVGGAVAALRVIEQINSEPAIDLVVTSIGMAVFLLCLPIAFSTLRVNDHGRHFAPAVLLGLSIDTALKGAFGTVDLSWVTGVWPLVIVVVLAIAQLWFLSRLDWKQAPTVNTGSWLLVAIGPFFFLQAQLFQNIGHITTVTGLSQPLAFEMIILANALGLIMADVVIDRLPRRAWTWTFVVGLILLVVSLPLTGDALAPLELLVGQVAASIGLAIISQARGSHPTAGVFGIGLLVMLVLIIGYYIGHAFILPIPAWLFQPIGALIVLIASVIVVLKSAGATTTDRVDWTAGIAGLSLMVLPVIALLSWREPVATAGQLPLRIMSYNLHSGFDVTGRLNLEGLAQTIEAEKADVVALQEVSRGWVLDGSVDVLIWLSQRLKMPFVWGPTADPMWGNAILSRYPIKAVQLYDMPNNDQIRPMRGYIVAKVEAGGQSITVMATHLHDPEKDSALRVPQVQAMLDTWGVQPARRIDMVNPAAQANRVATVLLGDLNAKPDWPEMQLAREAGLIDSFTEAGPGGDGFTWPAHAPNQRIDYIYHSPDLAVSDFRISPSTASDHRGVAVTIEAAR